MFDSLNFPLPLRVLSADVRPSWRDSNIAVGRTTKTDRRQNQVGSAQEQPKLSGGNDLAKAGIRAPLSPPRTQSLPGKTHILSKAPRFWQSSSSWHASIPASHAQAWNNVQSGTTIGCRWTLETAKASGFCARLDHLAYDQHIRRDEVPHRARRTCYYLGDSLPLPSFSAFAQHGKILDSHSRSATNAKIAANTITSKRSPDVRTSPKRAYRPATIAVG